MAGGKGEGRFRHTRESLWDVEPIRTLFAQSRRRWIATPTAPAIVVEKNAV